MSKCDLKIEFSRQDRRYRVGERIHGEVQIRVNSEFRSNGVILERYWRTHGRGNTERGEREKQRLDEGGQWAAGDLMTFPFEFPAPQGPATYRGTYLNIDHYIQVRVDVPWSFDPKLEEEFLLVDHGPSYEGKPKPPKPVTELATSVGGNSVGGILGVALLIAGVIFFCPFGIVLIPIGLTILFFSIRKSLAEKKLGKVSLDFPKQFVSPGETLPVRIDFTPRRGGGLRKVTLVLEGKELCVSGSGSNRTTHKHVISKQTVDLGAPTTLVAGSPVRLAADVAMPDTQAYSFDSSDNKIRWEAVIRFDLPNWPDWIETIPLVLVPAGGEGTPAGAAGRDFVEQPVTARLVDEPSPVPPGDSPVAAGSAAASVLGQYELVVSLDKLREASRFANDREEIIEQLAKYAFEFEVEIEDSERTYGTLHSEAVRGGSTVRGRVAGSSHQVVVQVSAAHDAALQRDPYRLKVTARPVAWSSLYERLEMCEVG